mmetsp:Transcript_3923/g.13412  ORF Transcript_3923/g.13412 Transcript_3923/m.13412 type:complete len:258 (-) Transcript_3923:759-1532(-)
MSSSARVSSSERRARSLPRVPSKADGTMAARRRTWASPPRSRNQALFISAVNLSAARDSPHATARYLTSGGSSTTTVLRRFAAMDALRRAAARRARASRSATRASAATSRSLGSRLSTAVDPRRRASVAASSRSASAASTARFARWQASTFSCVSSATRTTSRIVCAASAASCALSSSSLSARRPRATLRHRCSTGNFLPSAFFFRSAPWQCSTSWRSTMRTAWSWRRRAAPTRRRTSQFGVISSPPRSSKKSDWSV